MGVNNNEMKAFSDFLSGDLTSLVHHQNSVVKKVDSNQSILSTISSQVTSFLSSMVRQFQNLSSTFIRRTASFLLSLIRRLKGFLNGVTERQDNPALTGAVLGVGVAVATGATSTIGKYFQFIAEPEFFHHNARKYFLSNIINKA